MSLPGWALDGQVWCSKIFPSSLACRSILSMSSTQPHSRLVPVRKLNSCGFFKASLVDRL
jgi:hypothetical protein